MRRAPGSRFWALPSTAAVCMSFPRPRCRSSGDRICLLCALGHFIPFLFSKSSRWGPEGSLPGGSVWLSLLLPPTPDGETILFPLLHFLVKPIFPTGRKKEGVGFLRAFLRNPFPRRSSASSVLTARPATCLTPNLSMLRGR